MKNICPLDTFYAHFHDDGLMIDAILSNVVVLTILIYFFLSYSSIKMLFVMGFIS